MFFFFTCGTHSTSPLPLPQSLHPTKHPAAFQSPLKGAEHITVQCQNCGNFSGRVMKRWEWFTFCFVPLIPFSLKPYHEVGCHICNFWQDVKYRPDVQGQMQGGGGGQQQGAVGMGGVGGGHGAPPSGVPQYK